jgi:S1-C subfamily serine protease
MVVEVEDNSPADAAGLVPNDIIVEVNRQPVSNLSSYQRLVEPPRARELTLLLINRQGTYFYLPIEGE